MGFVHEDPDPGVVIYGIPVLQIIKTKQVRETRTTTALDPNTKPKMRGNALLLSQPLKLSHGGRGQGNRRCNGCFCHVNLNSGRKDREQRGKCEGSILTFVV